MLATKMVMLMPVLMTVTKTVTKFLGCIVCYSYLTTQWHHFVRSKTQISKRLYWLKRPAGCEIRQPVNIIELEEILSEQAREEEDRGSDSEDEGVCTSLGVTTKKEDEKKANQRSIGMSSKTIFYLHKV